MVVSQIKLSGNVARVRIEVRIVFRPWSIHIYNSVSDYVLL